MKIKLITLCLVAGLSTAAQAQFGLPSLGGSSSSSGGDVTAQVDSFNKDAKLIKEALAFALVQISGALGDKTQREAARASAANLAKNTNTKEAENIQGTILKEKAAETTAILASKEGKERMEKLDPEMKKKVADAILAVGISALKLPNTLSTGKKIMESVGSNPMNITKVLPVKDGIVLFAEVLPKLPDLVSTGFKMMRDVKMEPGNPSADATLKNSPPQLPEES